MTEIDICCRLVNRECQPMKYPDRMQQARVYKALIWACMEAPNCDSFATWGITDKYSWQPLIYNALLFDQNFGKKKAWWEVYLAMKDFPRDHPANIQRLKAAAERKLMLRSMDETEQEIRADIEELNNNTEEMLSFIEVDPEQQTFDFTQ